MLSSQLCTFSNSSIQYEIDNINVCHLIDVSFTEMWFSILHYNFPNSVLKTTQSQTLKTKSHTQRNNTHTIKFDMHAGFNYDRQLTITFQCNVQSLEYKY